MKISARIAFSFFLFLFTFNVFSQKEANIWYFGNGAGVDFNSGSPTALTNGALYTTEGVASICNSAGALLFYTDGDTIWNKNHVLMTNGSGLLGHYSSTQSGVIVPKPGSTSIYYVFTVDAQAGDNTAGNTYGGVAYSEVDMTLSGGLGSVTANKNISLVTPTTEKLTAVRHCNNTDIWVLCQRFNSTDIYAYLVTSSGVNMVPVISSGVGRNIYDQYWSGTGDINEETQGYMKVSPTGNKIALAHRWHGKIDYSNFNNSTGAVTGRDSLSLPGTVYGLEFSPNGNILYASYTYYDFSWGYTSRIVQFDMTLGSSAAVQASGISVGVFLG